MNLRIAVALDQNGGAFSRVRTANRLHRRHLRRRRRLLRLRLRRNRSGCPSHRRQPNYPRQNDARRTRQGSSYRRRRNCRYRWSCRRTIGDYAYCFASASSARSRPGTCSRPQFRMPPSRLSWFRRALKCRRGAQLCNARTRQPVPFRRQMWHPRSLIIQVKYGTFAATDCLSADRSLRKVTP
jgi:hypothetical protein